MNDDFIREALPEVRTDFAQALYARISAEPERSLRQGIYAPRKLPRRLQAAFILLGVLVLVAWSQMRLLIRYVPIGDLWLIEFSRSTQVVPSNQYATPFVPTPPHPPTVIIEIEGTKVILWYSYVFDYLAPEWIPEGFSATEPPGPGYSYEESIGMWINEARQTIRLFAVPRSGGARPYAPPGMYKEVRIHDQPAILIYGRLAPNSAENPQAERKWDETLGLQLSWSAEKSIYFLETLGPYLTEEDLIRMAESMKITGETTPP